jgi:hypothetical protein
VHGLKGASYGINADTIGKRAAALETAAKAYDFEKVKTGTDDFIKAAESLIRDLRELLDKVATKAPLPTKNRVPAPDRKLLAEVLHAAQRFNASLIEETLDKLEQFEYETDNELISWLRERSDNLEYDAIARRLSNSE